MGAIAFFGDKYGSSVRVVQAGPSSLEFCGGTHVDSLGQIGMITLLSEGSTGAGTRRIFALTGHASIERALGRERLVQSAAALLRAEPDELVAAIGRLVERQREAEKELSRLRQQSSDVGGAHAGRGGGGRRRSGRGPAGQRGARRAAQPGPGRPASRRSARRRARRLARRFEGGHRGRHGWIPRCHPARARAGRAGRWRGRGLARGGAGRGARTRRRSRWRWPRRNGFCPGER